MKKLNKIDKMKKLHLIEIISQRQPFLFLLANKQLYIMIF